MLFQLSDKEIAETRDFLKGWLPEFGLSLHVDMTDGDPIYIIRDESEVLLSTRDIGEADIYATRYKSRLDFSDAVAAFLDSEMRVFEGTFSEAMSQVMHIVQSEVRHVEGLGFTSALFDIDYYTATITPINSQQFAGKAFITN